MLAVMFRSRSMRLVPRSRRAAKGSIASAVIPMAANSRPRASSLGPSTPPEPCSITTAGGGGVARARRGRNNVPVASGGAALPIIWSQGVNARRTAR
jgi:hypothetical protein